MKNVQSDPYLWRHLRDLPYFRAMLRAVEARFYQDISLPAPVLDVGCGDGHFASMAFSHGLDVGLDPWTGPLKEASRRGCYRMVIQADGSRMPFPDGYFASAVSNSVLEHIPHVDEVLEEVARVVRPGGRFVFCVPNDRFGKRLLGTEIFRWFGLKGASQGYARFFNRVSRHAHTDSPAGWRARLTKAGFKVEKTWDYFSPQALHVLEAGHFFGLPSLVTRKVAGKWILWKSPLNLWLPWLITHRQIQHPVTPEGVYSFFITRRKG